MSRFYVFLKITVVSMLKDFSMAQSRKLKMSWLNYVPNLKSLSTQIPKIRGHSRSMKMVQFVDHL